MSYYDVLMSGDAALLKDRPEHSPLWNAISKLTCMTVIGGSKVVLSMLYDVKVKGVEHFENALKSAREQNRGIMTVMNHSSVCDDPFLWACLPWRVFKDFDDIRWGLAASNVCFNNAVTTKFFSLGKILPCERFGRGPFQPGIDACVRLLSPDNTMDEEHVLTKPSQFAQKYSPPIYRKKTSLVHIFPEAFVCQLQGPYNNSMRFFRWGTARLILEPTVAPVVVPIFSDGFEKIKPEKIEEKAFDFFSFQNRGGDVNVNIGKPLDEKIIEGFRREWKNLCNKYHDPANPNIMPDILKFGEEAKNLRSRVCAYLREQVANLRLKNGFSTEDSRFSNVSWWDKYTETKGESDPEVKFVGLNWAVKDYQKHLKRSS